MGRRPDPAGLQELKGNPGKRRKAAALPPAQAGTIAPPAKLTGASRDVWERLAPELVRMNFLRQTDAQAFARWCDAVVRYWKVSEELRKTGETYTSTSAHGELQRINPLFVVEERLAKRLESLEDRFGLNPAARQTIMLRLSQTQPQLPLALPKGEGAGEAAEAAREMEVAPSPIGILSRPERLN